MSALANPNKGGTLMKNKKLTTLILGGACLLTIGGAAFAATDIYPPEGTISIEGATYKDGVYYCSTTNVTLNIDAVDDQTPSGDIKMIVSNGPISGEIAVDDANWENFSTTKEWTLTNLSGENLIYLYLKDSANNVSPNIIADASSNFTVTYAGEGENLPLPKTAQYGVIFSVSMQEPTLEGKYFLGWSEAPNGSVQWLSDSIIEPRYIKGDKTLYAVYSDEAPLLADQVQIGDYVDYPVDYENVYTYKNGTQSKSTYTGWRVMNISGDEVSLISAGTPLLYYHGNNSAQSVKNLTTNFLSGDKYSGGEYTYDNIGLKGTVLSNIFGNEYTKEVSSMTKNDLDTLVGEESSSGYGLARFGSLLDNGTYYWLATAYYSTYLWRVDGGGSYVYGHSTSYNTSYGVRSEFIFFCMFMFAGSTQGRPLQAQK